MSRMSALTTFRLIASPTNPGCPYWRPWPCCIDMLSLAGLPMGLAGSGEGSGSAGSIIEVREDLAFACADAPTASANPLSDKPPAHATANALMAIFLKCLDIIPSSGMASERPSYASERERISEQPHCADVQRVVKIERRNSFRACGSQAAEADELRA